MEEEVLYWKPFGKGFYIACSKLDDFIGLAFTCAYIPSCCCFQVMLHMGTFAVAIGWDFNGEEQI